MGWRVRKFDGPSGRGLWYRYGTTLWPGFKGFRGFGLPLAGWFKGWWIALRAMLIKSALRDLLSVSYSMKSILVIGSLRSPPLSGFAGLPPMQGAE